MTETQNPESDTLPTRIALCGPPGSGKSTLARTFGLPVYSTDDVYKGREWSEVSEEVSTWFDREGSWVIEGMVVPRALRKWLARHPKGKPCNKLVWLNASYTPRSLGHENMGKSVLSTLQEILRPLQKRGVRVEGIPRTGNPKR